MSETPHARIMAVLDPTEANQPILDWLEKGGWCWGVEVTPDAELDGLRGLTSRGWRLGLNLPGDPDTLARQRANHGKPRPPVRAVLERLLQAAGGDPARVIWALFMEDDSAGVAFPHDLLREKPHTHAEAAWLLRERIARVHRIADEYPPVKRWAVCGYGQSTHAYAASPVETVLIERANDDCDDLQTGIAFCRGAAVQNGKSWGADMSLWWGPIYGCVQDLPASYHKRCLYMTYFSGASAYRLEGCDLLWDRAQNGPNRLGRLLGEFAAFTRRHAQDEPETPAAVVLPQDHGWMTPPYWETARSDWNYARLRRRPGARGVDGFFRTAFPGSSFEMEPFPFGAYESDEPPASPFALSCVTPEYAPSPADAFQAEPPLPFGRFTNRDEAREAMAAHIIDPGPYRPLGDSRWGGIFDILTDEAVEETLSRYKVVTLLGHMPLEAAFRRALVRFVSEGGVLVASAGVLGPEDIDLTGVRMKPELAVGRGWTWRDEPLQAEAFRYVPGAPVNEAQSVVLARAATGQPIIVRTRIGEGCVYVCQIPWFEGEAQPLAGAARRLFDQVYGLIQPVRVDGPPAQWTSARGEGRRTVAISNHGQQVWRGTVCVRGFDAALRACHELVSGRRVDFRRGLTEAAVELAIPPHDVRVLRFSR